VTSIHRCDDQFYKGIALFFFGAVLIAFMKFERSALSVAATAAGAVIIMVGVSMMSCFED
jgi:predicted phage tail protein